MLLPCAALAALAALLLVTLPPPLADAVSISVSSDSQHALELSVVSSLMDRIDLLRTLSLPDASRRYFFGLGRLQVTAGTLFLGGGTVEVIIGKEVDSGDKKISFEYDLIFHDLNAHFKKFRNAFLFLEATGIFTATKIENKITGIIQLNRPPTCTLEITDINVKTINFREELYSNFICQKNCKWLLEPPVAKKAMLKNIKNAIGSVLTKNVQNALKGSPFGKALGCV